MGNTQPTPTISYGASDEATRQQILEGMRSVFFTERLAEHYATALPGVYDTWIYNPIPFRGVQYYVSDLGHTELFGLYRQWASEFIRNVNRRIDTTNFLALNKIEKQHPFLRGQKCALRYQLV